MSGACRRKRHWNPLNGLSFMRKMVNCNDLCCWMHGCYTLILDLKILVQFFFSCIISHLICLWSIASFSAFYFNIVCKIHIEGYFSHFLHLTHFYPWKLFESFKLVCISPCFNLMSKFISKKYQLGHFLVSIAPRGILVISYVKSSFSLLKICLSPFK